MLIWYEFAWSPTVATHSNTTALETAVAGIGVRSTIVTTAGSVVIRGQMSAMLPATLLMRSCG